MSNVTLVWLMVIKDMALVVALLINTLVVSLVAMSVAIVVMVFYNLNMANNATEVLVCQNGLVLMVQRQVVMVVR